MKTSTAFGILAVVILAGVVFVFLRSSTGSDQPIATVSYACNAGKTITAMYYRGAAAPVPLPDQPPTPTGSVALTLSDGRSMTLPQTISADGTRYASADESFVFWSKGDGALVLENNVEKSYIGCIRIASASDGVSLPQVYANSGNGFSLRLPVGYTFDESYRYQALGPGKDIAGVKFIIPPSASSGTNLGSDTYISIEELPQTSSCTAAFFLNQGTVFETVEGNTAYSIASSTGAALGNRYEETVYALRGTDPCVAVRYVIHYGVIENYPAGTIREFDRPALLSQFDAIRRTLVTVQTNYNPGYKHATYTIGGKSVKLANGYAEAAAAPGSAAKTITQYFGNDAFGDLNEDGRPDVGFVLTQTSGGSGTFYYAVAALQTETGGYQGVNGILLGDRIAPQTTEIRDGRLIVNYAERAPGDPMTAQPSVGVSRYFRIQGATLRTAE